MVDFAQATLSTSPSPVTVGIKPVVTPAGSSTIKLTLQGLPNFQIDSSPSGSGWQQFNADVWKHATDIALNDMLAILTALIVGPKAQSYLDPYTFSVPSIPIDVAGVSLTITPSNLALSSNDQDHALMTATASIS